MPILNHKPLAIPSNESFILETDNLNYHLLLGKLAQIRFKLASLDWLIQSLTKESEFNRYKKYVSIKGVLQNRFAVEVLDLAQQEIVYSRLKVLLSELKEVTLTKDVRDGRYFVYLWSENSQLFLNIQTQVNSLLADINPNYSLEPSNFIVNSSVSNNGSVLSLIYSEKERLVTEYSELCQQLLRTPAEVI